MHEFNCVILVKKPLDMLFEKPECISCDYQCVNALLINVLTEAVYQCCTQYYNVFCGIAGFVLGFFCLQHKED